MDAAESSSSTSSAAVAAGASSSGSPASSSRNPHRLRNGVRLRMLRQRRRRLPPEPGRDGGGAVQEDLALPLGMSFAAVLAQVINTKNISGKTLHPAVLSKICTSAVKESLTNLYGDSSNSFIRNFEKSFSSTFRTLHLVNEIPVNEISHIPECSFKHDDSLAEDILSSSDLRNQDRIEHDLVNTVEKQLVLFSSGNQQLTHLRRSRSSPEADKHILNAIEKSVEQQTRSNELKEFEIGLNMRKLQLKQSQLALTSDSHMLEKIKLSLGFQKASFKGEKFKTQLQETRDAQILRTLIDFLMSHQLVPLHQRCHVIAVTRMCFGILMILAIAWLAFQRSATTGSNMPITFNLILLGIMCGFAGRFCTNTLGGDGNTWLMYWEVLCFIHLLGNLFPSFLRHILHGPVSVSDREQGLWLRYWVRRCLFYAVAGLIIPVLTGLLPFASLSDWKNHFAEEIKSFVIGDRIEA
uniref:CPR5-1 n=1 Tax=Leersia perrieri TaxID=77586 RepID=A0A0D9V9K1_9ORYZ